MAFEAGRRSDARPETVTTGPETVRACILALEAGRRDTTGSETVIIKPETGLLSSDSETQNRTVYAVGERLAVLKHVTEKDGIDLGRPANMLQFGRRTM